MSFLDGGGEKNGNNIIEGNLQIMGPSGLMAFAAVLIAIHPVLDDNDDANNVNGDVNADDYTDYDDNGDIGRTSSFATWRW